MTLILDSGVIFAALDEGDDDHEPCAELLTGSEEQLVIAEPVLVELDYWLRKEASLEVWSLFAEEIEGGAYTLWAVTPDVLSKAVALQERFADQPIGFVDAAVFATCETLGEDKVATLDRRHFSVLRTSEGRPLRLVP